MVSINTSYTSNSYYSAAAAIAGNSTKATTTASNAISPSAQSATSITLSEEALAALASKTFTEVVADTHAKLKELLQLEERTSLLEKGKLAVDLSSLTARELYAMDSDSSFTTEQREAAGLEMQRRLESALSGPAAVSDVTGNFTSLYRAAAEYLDSLGAEEKAGPEWIAARDAVTAAQKKLQADPKTLPDVGENDPVALYLSVRAMGEAVSPQPIANVANTARKTLDSLYADALANGKVPTYNKATVTGTYIDMSKFASRTLSAIVLDNTGQFSVDETSAAKSALRTKSGAALLAGFQSAAKSSDPTAFSQNIMSLFSSMSAEERQAAGWSDSFYQAAVDSYATTSKLTQMFAEAGGDSTGFLSWMGK